VTNVRSGRTFHRPPSHQQDRRPALLAQDGSGAHRCRGRRLTVTNRACYPPGQSGLPRERTETMADLQYPWDTYARQPTALSRGGNVSDQSWGTKAAMNRVLVSLQDNQRLTPDQIARGAASERRRERHGAMGRRQKPSCWPPPSGPLASPASPVRTPATAPRTITAEPAPPRPPALHPPGRRPPPRGPPPGGSGSSSTCPRAVRSGARSPRCPSACRR
jgi:hypothetical protein